MSKASGNAAVALDVPTAAAPLREFPFSENDFRNLVQHAYDYAGIALADSKRNFIYSRLSRRLRALKLASFREYGDYLDANPAEMESFVNAISTNLTKFFREEHHFEHLRAHIALPFVRAAQRDGDPRLRIWSAGCSTGEEPYTIATVMEREIRDIPRLDVRILATDIDTEVIATGERGEYPVESVENVSKSYREFFRPAPGRLSTHVAVADELRKLIAFRRLNLMDNWPFRGPFDAIFCRNVMIYFDSPTKMALIERFTQYIKPGGWLYIGHSEALVGNHPGLSLVGRTIYRRDA